MKSLPKSSRQEDLETISRNKLVLLFDPSLFEMRPEIQRDKGIDLVVEIKQDGSYTNFRFVIQLKATASHKPGKKEGVTFPVGIANLNYLLNYGMPAYYILYEHNSENFYLEPANQVYVNLLKKYRPDKFPRQFTVNFSTLLTAEHIEDMHRQTLENGLMLRKLMPHLSALPAGATQAKGIVIDSDNDVYSVAQNIEFINRFGFQLLTEARFEQVVEIEQRSHPRTNASVVFNLVCGVAYLQRSNFFKALELLRLAEKESAHLEPDIRSMLTYSILNARYSLGMIDEDTLQQSLAQLMQEGDIGSFLQLEKANKIYWNSSEKDPVRIRQLYHTMEDIIDQDPENYQARIVAYGRILDAEAKILIDDLTKNLMLFAGRVPDYKQTSIYKAWQKTESLYTKRLQQVLKYAVDKKQFFSASNLSMDFIK